MTAEKKTSWPLTIIIAAVGLILTAIIAIL